MLDNPKPKPGESQKDFIARCIPAVRKEHPSWKMNKVKAVCYDIWKRSHNALDDPEIEVFTDEAQLISVPKETLLAEDGGTVQSGKKQMIAVIGNRFMNGGFLSAEVLKKAHKQWEGTLHDINHMGTSTGFFLMQSDITYFVGWHSNVKYDEDSKSVSMNLNIRHDTKFAAAWEAYIGLCEDAGRIPNVSVTYYGKRKLIPASDLPPEADWKKEGYGKDDLVPVLTEITPVCVSTVLEGRCNDKDGCGLRNTSLMNETTSSCNAEQQQELDEEIEKQKQELIKWLKENDK